MLIEYVIYEHGCVIFGDCWWTTITCYMQSTRAFQSAMKFENDREIEIDQEKEMQSPDA